MTPITKEPFTSDDDAIVATNALEMRFFLERAGCVIESAELCFDVAEQYRPRRVGLRRGVEARLIATPGKISDTSDQTGRKPPLFVDPDGRHRAQIPGL